MWPRLLTSAVRVCVCVFTRTELPTNHADQLLLSETSNETHAGAPRIMARGEQSHRVMYHVIKNSGQQWIAMTKASQRHKHTHTGVQRR